MVSCKLAVPPHTVAHLFLYTIGSPPLFYATTTRKAFNSGTVELCEAAWMARQHASGPSHAPSTILHMCYTMTLR